MKNAKINSKELASLTTWKKQREKGGKQVIEQKECCSGKGFEFACLALLTALSLVLFLICALLTFLSLSSIFFSPRSPLFTPCPVKIVGSRAVCVAFHNGGKRPTLPVSQSHKLRGIKAPPQRQLHSCCPRPHPLL